MDNPLVQPDPGLFIWTIVTFLVLLIVDHDYLNGETVRMDGALRMAPR